MDLYATAATQSGAGQYDAALINYQSAYALKREPTLLYNIGRMQQKLDRLESAVTNYQKFLDLPVEKTERAQRVKAQLYLKQVQHQLEERKRLLSGSPVPEKPKLPIYQRPWLWTVVGVAVAGVVVGSTLGALSQQPSATGATEIRPSF